MSEVKIPEGYKQTEVGVIPEDWEVTTIGEFSPLQRGFDLPTPKVQHGNYPVVYSNGALRTHKYFQVKGPGIVTGRSGTIGKVHYIEDNFWPHNTSLWVTNFGNAYVKFVYYLFHKIGFERFKSGSGVPTLNRNDAHSYKIAVPTNISEQKSIANALSDTDNLIQSLEKLITKKEAIKTGTMQQLLTGKTRLPEFATREDGSVKGFKQTELGRIPEDWEDNFIKNVVKITTGDKNTQDKVDTGKYPFFVRSQTVERINTYSFDGEGVLTAGDGVGTGKIYHYINGKFDYHQRVYLMYDFGDRLNGYYFYLYFSNNFFNRIMSMTAKSSVDSVRREMIADMLIALPSKPEQTAIATILSDMDAEIQALQDRLEKTKEIKQGMMQQLLTGKVRLV